MKLGFIGAGNMGGAILRGYAPAAQEKGDRIFVYNRTEETRRALEEKFTAVTACSSAQEVAEKSDVVLLGIKPKDFADFLPTIADVCTDDKLFVSMAAGISIDFIEGFLGASQPVIRIMPNTPAQVGEAMTAVCRNSNVSDPVMESMMEVFRAIGKAEEVDEEMIHCVIGVSGSSPAYTYMFIDALIQAAVENGMPEDKARTFAAQAVLGAAKMVLENEDATPEQLWTNVCSPGGTTIEAVNAFFENGLQEKVKEGFQAAVDKSVKLTK